MSRRITVLLALTSLLVQAQVARKLLVVSIDGLDQRYLANADGLGLRAPNLRKLMREGQWSEGVVGVVPTVTWPSHTTIITGVDPSVHGIKGNRRPQSEGGDYYWSASLLKAPTLLDAMKAAGRTSSAITWPVTVDAPLTFNLPEYFQRRRGGDMDTVSVLSKAVPADFADRISSMFPAFRQQWMEDRTRAMAVLYLLKTAQPDLILVHLVDLDSEAHDTGPFSPEANATLEHLDELLGDMLRALPSGYNFALVSDHGFEKIDQVVNLGVIAKVRGVKGVRTRGAIVVAETPEAGGLLEKLKSEGGYGIGRQIPADELERFSPDLGKAAAVYESAAGYEFGFGEAGPERSKPRETGNHGHWPTRYSAVYLAWGPGVRAERLPEISQKDIAGRLASLLGIEFEPTKP